MLRNKTKYQKNLLYNTETLFKARNKVIQFWMVILHWYLTLIAKQFMEKLSKYEEHLNN